MSKQTNPEIEGAAPAASAANNPQPAQQDNAGLIAAAVQAAAEQFAGITKGALERSALQVAEAREAAQSCALEAKACREATAGLATVQSSIAAALANANDAAAKAKAVDEGFAAYVAAHPDRPFWKKAGIETARVAAAVGVAFGLAWLLHGDGAPSSTAALPAGGDLPQLG